MASSATLFNDVGAFLCAGANAREARKRYQRQGTFAGNGFGLDFTKGALKSHFSSIRPQSHLLLAIFQISQALYQGCWSKFALGGDLGASSVEDEGDWYHNCGEAAE
jgi:hypothetical protein